MISNSGQPGRRLAFAFAPLLALTVACEATSDSYGEESGSSGRVAESEQTAPGRFGSHGMVISGEPGAAFLSHIPLFAFPHDVQVITAGSFSVISGPPLPATFSNALFTFLPERMSLDALRLGDERLAPALKAPETRALGDDHAVAVETRRPVELGVPAVEAAGRPAVGRDGTVVDR